MGKLENSIRELVLYHSKRAAAEVFGDMPAHIRQIRKDLRAIEKSVETLATQIRKLEEARLREMAVPPASDEATDSARVTKRTLKALRQGFDLTQAEMAKLLEVAPVTVTSWETDKTKPRQSNLAQIITLRGMEQEEVDKALGRPTVPSAPTPRQLRKLREEMGLTQGDLASLLDVSHTAVTSWEAGRTVPGRQARAGLDNVQNMTRADVSERLGRDVAIIVPSDIPMRNELSPTEVRTIRQELGLSQRELARRLGVTTNSICNWETARSTPRVRSVRALLALRASA